MVPTTNDARWHDWHKSTVCAYMKLMMIKMRNALLMTYDLVKNPTKSFCFKGPTLHYHVKGPLSSTRLIYSYAQSMPTAHT